MFRILATIFLFKFFIIASPIVGMFTVFMLDANQTPIMMAFTVTSFMIAMNLFEVPSSIIADKFSRKMVIISAIIVTMVSDIFFLFSWQHWAFILHMVMAGIGVALLSGTVEAFLYDELKAIKREDFYQKANAIYHIAWSLGLSASLFLSSWLVQYGWHVVITTSLCLCFASFIVFALGAKETKHVKQVNEPHSVRDIFLEGGRIVLKKQIVRYLALVSFIYGAVNCTMSDTAMVTSIELGWDRSHIAKIFGCNTIFEAIITFFFAKYVTKFSLKSVHIILIIAIAFVLCGMFFTQKWSIFMVFPLWWCDRLKNMVIDAQIQHHIHSSSRATTTSFISMCFGIKYTLLMFIMCSIATFYSFTLGFVVVSLIGIALLIPLLLLPKKIPINVISS